MSAGHRRAESQELEPAGASPISGLRAKARRRGGFVLLTMSTPAPALPRRRHWQSQRQPKPAERYPCCPRRPLDAVQSSSAALYPKLRPGPHGSGERRVESARALVRGDDRDGRHPWL
jgi:hypothetical protein